MEILDAVVTDVRMLRLITSLQLISTLSNSKLSASGITQEMVTSIGLYRIKLMENLLNCPVQVHLWVLTTLAMEGWVLVQQIV